MYTLELKVSSALYNNLECVCTLSNGSVSVHFVMESHELISHGFVLFIVMADN